jgi:hypothetical protein
VWVTWALTVAASAALVFPSQPEVTGPTADITLNVQRDGRLSVIEKVTVPAGQQLTGHIPLRVDAGNGQDRRYTIRDVKTDGAGTAELTGDQLVLSLRGGASTVSYTVNGAVTGLIGGRQVQWQLAGGWDTGLARITATFTAPVREMSSVDCFAGITGSSQRCTLSEVDPTGVARVEQDGLTAGDRVELTVGLPGGAVAANARFEQASVVFNAFALTVPVEVVFAVLAVFLVFGGLAVWWLRKRDVRTLTAAAIPVDALPRDGDRVSFRPPDGVLPGLLGTVVGESVDVVDISGTVVDLAVRNLLRIAEVHGPSGSLDWRLSRCDSPDGQVHEFERLIVEALLPDGTDIVLLSELRSRAFLDLGKVSDAMYTDVVRGGWFWHRPDSGRNRLTWLGAGFFGLGAVSTMVLAGTAGHALLGVAVAIAGIALALGAGWVPSRTARGRALVGWARGLSGCSHIVEVTGIPAADQVRVLSRSLPYAVVLGDTEGWLETFARLEPAANGAAGLPWFAGLEPDSDRHTFAARFPAFLTALDGVVAESGRRSSIRSGAEVRSSA